VIETTFKEETEDRSLRRAGVCYAVVHRAHPRGFEPWSTPATAGGGLLQSAFTRLKLIVDLIHEHGGSSGMRYSISDTAEYGDIDPRLSASSATTCARDGVHPGGDPDGEFARE